MFKNFLKKYLTETDLDLIAARIGEAERTTSGEIRMSIRHRRHWNERNLPLHELAIKEFHRLQMHRTKDRTGVLILLLFHERKFHIVADEGIQQKVDEGTWDSIAETMSAHFRQGNFRDGICDAVGSVGAILTTHFPGKADDRDELPNNVDVG